MGLHRAPSLLDRIRYWMSRPAHLRAAAICDACNGSDDGECECIADCGARDPDCQGGFA
jgi:hypothetical protein